MWLRWMVPLAQSSAMTPLVEASVPGSAPTAVEPITASSRRKPVRARVAAVAAGLDVALVEAAEAPDGQGADGGVVGVGVDASGQPSRGHAVGDLQLGPGDCGQRRLIRGAGSAVGADADGTGGADGGGVGLADGGAVGEIVGGAVDGGRGVDEDGEAGGHRDPPPVVAPAVGCVGRLGGHEPHRVGAEDGVGVLEELPQRPLDGAVGAEVVVGAVAGQAVGDRVERKSEVDGGDVGGGHDNPADVLGAACTTWSANRTLPLVRPP